MSNSVGAGPSVSFPDPMDGDTETVIRNLAKLNSYDRCGKFLERLIADGELADYDDELANTVRIAIRICRGVVTLAERIATPLGAQT